jgi:hypothetical protein
VCGLFWLLDLIFKKTDLCRELRVGLTWQSRSALQSKGVDAAKQLASYFRAQARKKPLRAFGGFEGVQVFQYPTRLGIEISISEKHILEVATGVAEILRNSAF